MFIRGNKAIALCACEIFSNGDLDPLDEVRDRNSVDDDPVPGQEEGFEGAEQLVSSIRKDLHEIQWINASGQSDEGESETAALPSRPAMPEGLPGEALVYPC